MPYKINVSKSKVLEKLSKINPRFGQKSKFFSTFAVFYLKKPGCGPHPGAHDIKIAVLSANYQIKMKI